jgi:hypothetical protein
LVVNYEDLIKAQNNVMCNLNYNPSGFHHCLVHELCHGLDRTITVMFFLLMLGIAKNSNNGIKYSYSNNWTALLQEMTHNGKLNNFPRFFSYHPMCQLGINSLLATRCKCFLVIGMLTNLGIKPIPSFHIKPHTLHNFLMTCMLTKGIPFSSKYFVFPFYLNTNLAFDNVQGSIFPYKHSTHGSFASHISWNFLVTS